MMHLAIAEEVKKIPEEPIEVEGEVEVVNNTKKKKAIRKKELNKDKKDKRDQLMKRKEDLIWTSTHGNTNTKMKRERYMIQNQLRFQNYLLKFSRSQAKMNSTNK
jgi:hypothetical protein